MSWCLPAFSYQWLPDVPVFRTPPSVPGRSLGPGSVFGCVFFLGHLRKTSKHLCWDEGEAWLAVTLQESKGIFQKCSWFLSAAGFGKGWSLEERGSAGIWCRYSAIARTQLEFCLAVPGWAAASCFGFHLSKESMEFPGKSLNGILKIISVDKFYLDMF